jgi:hypothetical protein
VPLSAGTTNKRNINFYFLAFKRRHFWTLLSSHQVLQQRLEWKCAYQGLRIKHRCFH